MKISLTYLFLFFLATSSVAQQVDLVRAGKVLQKATIAYDQARYPDAVTDFLDASQSYRQSGTWDGYVRAMSGYSRCAMRLSDYAKAGEYINKALSVVSAKLQGQGLASADADDAYSRFLFENGNYEKALDYAQKALELRADASPEEQLASVTLLADIYMALPEKLSECWNMLGRAQSLINDNNIKSRYTVDAWRLTALYWYEMEDYEKLKQSAEKALQLALDTYGTKHDLTADCYDALAIYYKVGLPADDIQLDYLLKAFDIREALFGDKATIALSESFQRIAGLYFNLSDYDNALDYYHKAQDICIAVYKGENHPDVAYLYNRIALCFNRKNNPDSEFPRLSRAMEIQLATLPPNHLDLAETYNNLGVYYGRQQIYDLQLEYTQKALDIWSAAKGPESYYASIAYANMSAAFSGIAGEEGKELEYLQKALDIKVRLFGAVDPKTSRNYYQVGRYYKKTHDYKSALENFQKSLVASCRNYTGETFYNNPKIGQVATLGQFVETMRFKAQTFVEMYQTESKKLKDLEFAYETYKICLDAIDTIRLDINSSGSKQDYLVRYLPVFDETIGAANELYLATHKQFYLEEAFRIAERSKALLLLQALKESENRGLGAVPEEVIRKERELRRRIDYYEKQLFEMRRKQQDSIAGPITDSLRSVKQAYSIFLRDLEKNYPRYFNLKYNTEPASAALLQRRGLDRRSALIEYFWSDTTVWVFTLTRNKISLRKVAKPGEVDDAIENLRLNLSNYASIVEDAEKSYKNYISLAYPLYHLFLEPELNDNPGVERLLVVPDGDLNKIPFEALLMDTIHESGVNFATLPYLIRKYSVSYSYSATLLLENLARSRQSGYNRCLAFAPSYDGDPVTDDEMGDFEKLKSTAKPLPGAQAEVKAVATYFKGKPYFGHDATESNFKSNAPNYNMIHLAMHGFMSDKNPDYSLLAFSENDPDTTQDNVLHAYELYGMALRADMVVLSACETGRGGFQRGEGVLSLARSFMFAGSSSVVMSLWKVNDYSTSKIMADFYKALSKGLSKDEALRVAKLNYLESASKINSHPAYWAGFVAVGSPTPLVTARGWEIWLLAALCLGVYLWMWRTRMSKI